MLRITKLLILTLVVIGSSLTANAQKYGHINTGNLLIEMPETKAADAAIMDMDKKLSGEYQMKVEAFQTEYMKFQEAAQGGTKSQVELEAWQGRLQKSQESIQQFTTESEQKIAKKRQELLEPLLTRVQNAIESVAKENGYSMIFDTSTGALMFAKDSDDVTALVKAKL